MFQPKCHQYWPLGPKYSDDDTLVFNDTGIKVTLLEENELNYFVVSTLELEDLEVRLDTLYHTFKRTLNG